VVKSVTGGRLVKGRRKRYRILHSILSTWSITQVEIEPADFLTDGRREKKIMVETSPAHFTPTPRRKKEEAGGCPEQRPILGNLEGGGDLKRGPGSEERKRGTNTSLEGGGKKQNP